MKYWKKLSHAQQDKLITEALRENIDYQTRSCLGIPASKLDPNVFSEQASFLKDAPLLRTYVQNPNHIGCHTLGDSELFFSGTQKLEAEVIEVLSVDLLKAAEHSCDGYIASGGTEANIQAAWMYRNHFINVYGANQHEIALIGTEDTHYSIAKAANLLHLSRIKVAVDNETRAINIADLEAQLLGAKQNGIRYFIVIANMGTTMFGSVDDPFIYTSLLRKHKVDFRLHIDAAFGGFILPVSDTECSGLFNNPDVSSITLDAHKMLQAPYGTGIFIARKGLIEYVYTREAQYVHGMDITLCGSRSGANAIAVWMILFTYGPYGWQEKINKLIYRTQWCCEQLKKLGISFYRREGMNIITIPAREISEEVALHYGLVPDAHHGQARWYKIVVMDHVELDSLQAFINDLSRQRNQEELSTCQPYTPLPQNLYL